MPLRFKLLITLFLLLVLMLRGGTGHIFTNVIEVFFALCALLVVSVVSLWPNEGRADRAERQANRGAWADRIDIEAIAADYSEQNGRG